MSGDGLRRADVSGESGPVILGGALDPLGNTVAFLRSPCRDVVEHRVQSAPAERLVIDDAGKMPDALGVLDPMEAPWTVELFVDCGQWTAYFNNFIGGGDPSARAPALGRELNVDCVTAGHSPSYGPGHATTLLWIQGPTGQPPLMGVRNLQAQCQDGRWSWHTWGTPQAYEELDRYRARRVRDRFDRAMLIEYLDALGIHVDATEFWGWATSVRQLVDWDRRQQSAAEWRRSNA